MLKELITKRRSVRKFQNLKIDDPIVKDCILNATLAPNSSNLQLWEFYHINDVNILRSLKKACLLQNAAKTAQQMVVVVTRQDLWKERANDNIKFLKSELSKGKISKNSFRKGENYYKKIIPFIYFDFYGIFSFFRLIIAQIIGLFRPIYRQVTYVDKRIIAHKSAALAAQNFMLSMSNYGYDTCPMEGSDTLRVKKILNLPRKSEINMVIACGIKDKNGIYSKRFRIPFKNVYYYI